MVGPVQFFFKVYVPQTWPSLSERHKNKFKAKFSKKKYFHKML